MDSQYKLLSELLSDQAAFITSPKTSLVNYWGGGGIAPLPPSVYGPAISEVRMKWIWALKRSNRRNILLSAKLNCPERNMSVPTQFTPLG